MRDVAVIAFAHSASTTPVEETETQMLFPVVQEAITRSGIPRREIGFTCSGSCDYLTGAPFSFVQNLEATGAWPPISESHVEMDGAWALYEAWVRLQHGDIETALVFSSGISSRVDLRRLLVLQLDPYSLAPLWPDHWSLAALQARALLATGRYTEADLAAVVARSRAATGGEAAGTAAALEALLAEPYVASPLRAHDCPPATDGAAAVMLAVGDTARRACERPAWIRGIDHRTDAHYPGIRDLSSSPSAALAARMAGIDKAPVEVAELSAAFSHEELILREALELGDDVVVNPSGGALVSNPIMATGLVRIGKAFEEVSAHGRSRVAAHAASGPCLQQNLVCVLEGE